MENMIKMIRRSDFLGHNFSIKINSESGYKSIFGGILSLVIIILSSIMIFYLGLEMFQKNDPIVINSKIQNKEFGPYNLSRDDIQFFIGLEYSNFTYYYDESIYLISAEESTVEYKEENGTVKQVLTTRNINLRRCSELFTIKDIVESGLNIPLDLFACVDPQENAQINGFWGNKISKSLKVKLNKCKNHTESNIICRPKEEIDKIIQNGVLSIYTSDYLVDQNNFTNPTKKYYRDVYNYLSSNDGLIYVIAYSDFSFRTDNGFIFPIYSYTILPMIIDIKNSYSFGEDQMFAFINFQGFKLGESYQRTYSKFQDILTRVGGLIKALTLIGVAINYVFSKPFFIIDNILDNHNFAKLYIKEKKDFECRVEISDSSKNQIFISRLNRKINPNLTDNMRNKSLSKFFYYKKKVQSRNNINTTDAKSNSFHLKSEVESSQKKLEEEGVIKRKKTNGNYEKHSMYTKSLSRINLFKSYWCPKSNPKLTRIFSFKENLIDKVLSLETLNRIYIDVELIKILNYNINDVKLLDEIHFNLLYDIEIYEKLRNHLYLNKENSPFKNLTIFSIFKDIDDNFKKRIKYFQI